MAKLQRRVVGSVCKGKDGGADYIKIRDDLNLRKGQVLRLESAKAQRASAEEAIKAGKLSAEMGEKVLERIDNIPEWVRFEIVSLEEKKS